MKEMIEEYSGLVVACITAMAIIGIIAACFFSPNISALKDKTLKILTNAIF